jgi:mannan endo-1,4-beta-mannosidase
MLNSSFANLEAAKSFATAFVANSSEWSKEIGKPVFLEEFGMARNNWENVGKEYPYLSSAGTSNKDNYFTVSLAFAYPKVTDC